MRSMNFVAKNIRFQIFADTFKRSDINLNFCVCDFFNETIYQKTCYLYEIGYCLCYGTHIHENVTITVKTALCENSMSTDFYEFAF